MSDLERARRDARRLEAVRATGPLDAPPTTGLGLHIVRGIVERHGGAVRVDSRIGSATTFEIGLPLASPP